MSCRHNSSIGASWILLHQMVRSELVSQCVIQGDRMEECVGGVVGRFIMFAEMREELDLVSWDKGGTYLILQSPCTWLDGNRPLVYSPPQQLHHAVRRLRAMMGPKKNNKSGGKIDATLF